MRSVLVDIAILVGTVLGGGVGAVLYTVYVACVEMLFGNEEIGLSGFGTTPMGGFIGAAIIWMVVGIWRDLNFLRQFAVVLVVLPIMFSLYGLFYGVVDVVRGGHFNLVVEILPALVTSIFVLFLPRLVGAYKEARGVALEK